MKTVELKEYLRQIMELECSIFEQEEAKKIIEKDYKLVLPQKPKMKKIVVARVFHESKPKEPTYDEIPKNPKPLFISLFVISMILGIIFICNSLFALGIVLIIGSFSFIGALNLFSKSYNEAVENNQKKKSEYEVKLAEYESKIKEEDKRIRERQKELDVEAENELITQTDKYNQECEALEKNYETVGKVILQMKQPLEEAKKLLSQLYSMNIIFSKYRNMVAICTMYEYFLSGRVSELEGPDGAYNLYEAETRQNIIIGQLATIITQLEQIKQNQYALYAEMCKTNKVIEGISKDINAILKNTETIVDYSQAIEENTNITACCSQAIARNVEALKYISLIS